MVNTTTNGRMMMMMMVDGGWGSGRQARTVALNAHRHMADKVHNGPHRYHRHVNILLRLRLLLTTLAPTHPEVLISRWYSSPFLISLLSAVSTAEGCNNIYEQ